MDGQDRVAVIALAREQQFDPELVDGLFECKDLRGQLPFDVGIAGLLGQFQYCPEIPVLLLQSFPLTQLPFERGFPPADAGCRAGVFPEIGLFGLTFQVLKVGGQFREVKDALVAPLPVRQCASHARGFLPTCWDPLQ
jgi:hypothetical protein